MDEARRQVLLMQVNVLIQNARNRGIELVGLPDPEELMKLSDMDLNNWARALRDVLRTPTTD
jgi:hypothetical protein